MNDSFSHAARLQTKLNNQQTVPIVHTNGDTNLSGETTIQQDANKLTEYKSSDTDDSLTNFSPEQVEPTPPASEPSPPPIIVRRLPNGVVITEDPSNLQPYRVTTWPDGTRLVEHYLDGINVLHQPDGTRTTTFSDGSMVRTFPSGKKVVTRP